MIQNIIGSRLATENQNFETPSLVETRQGVSVLYKDHFLYSKYDPSKAILNIISNLSIPEYSIILIFSPVLWLGLKELLAKLPATSSIAVFEYEKPLFDFAQENFPNELKDHLNNKIQIFNKSGIKNYFTFIQKQHFRKCLKIDFSAASALYKDDYNKIFSLTQRVIDQFWKNRLTLIKFGRLYSKNIFKNLTLLSDAIPLASLYKSVNKPILVLGAGESLNTTILELKKNFSKFFIICVDVAAAPLLDNGITPDAIIAVEGQQVIEKSYIGTPADSKCLLIMDLVSRNHIPYITKGKYSFFVSNYADMNFFELLKNYNLLPPVIKPLGSVGLVSMEIALKLRKDINIPVLFSGLDFSYSIGITHAKGTASHKALLSSTSKLKSVFNISSAFSTGTSSIICANGKKMITSKALESYALLFNENFEDEQNIFDIRTSGINLTSAKADLDHFIESLPANLHSNSYELNLNYQAIPKSNITSFLQNEKQALEELKDLFTYADNSALRKKDISLNEQIDSILTNREYLFIHFPDAVGPTNPQSYYNRIRIELDFFLKEINVALSLN
nr:6-hydroxymethylpterin diphosphokinase MptE-like protein [uncultured Treponema sp.]